MKRNTFMVLMFALVLLLVTACGSGDSKDKGKDTDKDADSKEKIVLKFATSQPETHAMTQGALKPFMEKVTEKTDGQVEFEFYPAEQLGKIADLLDLTTDGVTDISYFYTAYYGSQMPMTAALSQIPGLYETAYEGSMGFHELNKQSPILETDFLSNGVRPIWTYAAPSSEFFTRKKEIKVPEDLKRMKVRVGGEFSNRAITKLEGTPMNVTLAEMYEGFERGVFDVVNLNTPSTNDYGLKDLIKYGTKGVNFGGSLTGLIINEKVFQGLPKNVQEVLMEVGDEFTASNAKFYDEYTTEVEEDFTDSGINMHELTDDEREQWAKYYSEMEKNWAAEQKNEDFDETLSNLKEEIEKHK